MVWDFAQVLQPVSNSSSYTCVGLDTKYRLLRSNTKDEWNFSKERYYTTG